MLFLAFFLLVSGQALASWRSPRAGLAYLLAVGTMDYFSVWLAGALMLSRTCGTVFAVLTFLRHGNRARPGPKSLLLLGLLYGYPVLITLLSMTDWPTNAMNMPAIYSSLRGITQIVFWTLRCFVGWQVASALMTFNLYDLRRTVAIASCLLCLFGWYQVFANKVGLPVNGITRPYETYLGTEGRQDFASTKIGDTEVGRASSLVGEPRGLGSYCLFWLTFTLPIVWRRPRLSARALAVPIVILVTLALTLSTSAWIAAIVVVPVEWLVLYTTTAARDSGVPLRRILLTLALALVLTATYLGWKGTGELEAIFQARFAERIADPEANIAEITAVPILLDSPRFMLLGSGMGGISLYIADYLGGGLSYLVLVTNGILLSICDTGALYFLFTCGCTLYAAYSLIQAEKLLNLESHGFEAALMVFLFTQYLISPIEFLTFFYYALVVKGLCVSGKVWKARKNTVSA